MHRRDCENSIYNIIATNGQKRAEWDLESKWVSEIDQNSDQTLIK